MASEAIGSSGKATTVTLLDKCDVFVRLPSEHRASHT